MKSNEETDLPSLTTFYGEGYNFFCIGSVIIESIDLHIYECRYPSVIM